MNYALVNENGIVTNVIVINDGVKFPTPENFLLVKNDAGAGIGWLYKNGTFSPPESAQTPAQAWGDYQARARAELEGTSKTMERIIEAVSLGATKFDAEDVVAYMAARKARRDVLSQSSGDPSLVLPALVYPSGT